MDPTEEPRRAIVGAIRSLAGWLVLIAAVGIVVSLVSTTAERPLAPSATAVQPFAQLTSQVLDTHVWSLAFSPDGSHLASATIGGSVWLKDLATGQSTRLQASPIGTARSVAFSPDGCLLAIAGAERHVGLWDLASTTELCPLEFNSVQTKEVATSPDGLWLAVGENRGPLAPGAISLFDWKNRQRRAVLVNDHPGVIFTLRFSPDATVLAVADFTGNTTLWNMAERRQRLRLQTHDHGGVWLAFSPDGSRLATAGGFARRVRLWDPTSGKPQGEIRAGESGVTQLAFSPDGAHLAIAMVDGAIWFWGMRENRQLAVLRVPGGSVRSLAFPRDGKTIATGGADGVLRIWDLALVLGGRPTGGP